MVREELLKLVEELKNISTSNSLLLSELKNVQDDDVKRTSITAEIEKLGTKQGEIMSILISLCKDKVLLDNFKKYSEEKDKLFQEFSDAKNEEELVVIEQKIIKNVELWIESFQNIVTTILK